MTTYSGFEWQKSPEDVWSEAYRQYMMAVNAGVEAIAMKWAPTIQNWMRDNAPWTDRTGNARQSLHTEVLNLTNEIVLALAHGVEYGVQLELGFSGRYAIIGPALDEFYGKIWNDVKAMLGQ
jgi:hypothetical protein